MWFKLKTKKAVIVLIRVFLSFSQAAETFLLANFYGVKVTFNCTFKPQIFVLIKVASITTELILENLWM